MIFGCSKQQHENWALFGQLDCRVADELILIDGLRYDSEKKTFAHFDVGAGAPVLRACQADFGAGTVDTTISGSETWSNLSPKLGAQYFSTPETMGYATWSRAFRSGGFNGRATSPTTIGPFDEEQADNYETGVKSDFLDGRLRTNVAAFGLEYDDLQRPVIRPNRVGGGGQETVTENVGEARTRGIELEATALATPNLSGDWTLGYLDPGNREFCAPLQGVRPADEPRARWVLRFDRKHFLVEHTRVVQAAGRMALHCECHGLIHVQDGGSGHRRAPPARLFLIRFECCPGRDLVAQ